MCKYIAGWRDYLVNPLTMAATVASREICDHDEQSCSVDIDNSGDMFVVSVGGGDNVARGFAGRRRSSDGIAQSARSVSATCVEQSYAGNAQTQSRTVLGRPRDGKEGSQGAYSSTECSSSRQVQNVQSRSVWSSSHDQGTGGRNGGKQPFHAWT